MYIRHRKTAWMLAIALLISVLSPLSSAFAADSDFTVVNGVITKYSGTAGVPFSIPNAINGVTITGVGDGVFRFNKDLKGSLPSGLTVVGNYSFYGCTGLARDIPQTVESIGQEAFPRSSALYVYKDSYAHKWADENNYTYELINDALGVTVAADKTTATAGDTVTWTATAVGRAGEKQYRFYLYKGNDVKIKTVYSTSNTYSCAITEPGTYAVRAYVVDAAGTTAKDMSGKVIVSEKALRLTAVTATVGMGASSNTVTCTASSVGGAGGNMYRFYIYNGNTIEGKSDYTTDNTFTYTLKNTDFEVGTTFTYAVRAYVVDANGAADQLMSNSVNLTVNSLMATIGSMEVRGITPNVTSATVGDTVTWEVFAVRGGSYYDQFGEFQYRFYLYKESEIIQKTPYSADETFSYTFTEPGRYAVRAYAVLGSRKGSRIGGYVTVTDQTLKIASVTANTGSASVGGTATWTAQASGGAGGNQYRFYLYNGNNIVKKTAYSADNTFSCTFTEPGTYAVRTYVVDVGNAADNRMGGYVTVTDDPLRAVSVKPNAIASSVGGTATWTVKASGGGGGYQYRYYLYNGGAVVKKTAYSADNTFSCTFVEPGNYAVHAYVTDANNASVNRMSATVTVE